MARQQSVFECQACGYASAKWLGRCPDCGSWSSFMEEKRVVSSTKKSRATDDNASPIRIAEISSADAPRIATLNPEFDRVLTFCGLLTGRLIAYPPG